MRQNIWYRTRYDFKRSIYTTYWIQLMRVFILFKIQMVGVITDIKICPLQEELILYHVFTQSSMQPYVKAVWPAQFQNNGINESPQITQCQSTKQEAFTINILPQKKRVSQFERDRKLLMTTMKRKIQKVGQPTIKYWNIPSQSWTRKSLNRTEKLLH